MNAIRIAPLLLNLFPCKEQVVGSPRPPFSGGLLLAAFPFLSLPLSCAALGGGVGGFFHSFFFTVMLRVSFSPSLAAPSWSSLVALSLGSASSVCVRPSSRSFSGFVAVFSFRSSSAASAWSARCAGLVGCFCVVRSVVGRGGVPLWCVSVPCVVWRSAPRAWVRPAAALASLRGGRRVSGGGVSWF